MVAINIPLMNGMNRMETIQNLTDRKLISRKFGAYNLFLMLVENCAIDLKKSLDGHLDNDPLELTSWISECFTTAHNIYKDIPEHEGLVDFAESRYKAALKPLFPQLNRYPNIKDYLPLV